MSRSASNASWTLAGVADTSKRVAGADFHKDSEQIYTAHQQSGPKYSDVGHFRSRVRSLTARLPRPDSGQRSACEEKHQSWPAAAAHTRHTHNAAAARRLRLFRETES